MQLHNIAAPHRAGRTLRRLADALERTIEAERQLLGHPLFAPRAARVMVRSRTDLRRIRAIGRGISSSDF